MIQWTRTRQCVDDLGRFVQVGIPPEARDDVYSLCMDDCGISALPDCLTLLRKLETLSARSNPFQLLPRALLDLSSLTVLRLSSCGLLRLPLDIGKRLPRLYELLLGSNQLRSLPCSLCLLAGTLTTLDVYNNPLPAHGSTYCARDANSARRALQSVERDFGLAEKFRARALCFIAVFKFKRYEVVVPKDVGLIIARLIFAGRLDNAAATAASVSK